ncbi:MAG: hypothetical protein PHD97_12440 [Bacteroidales bacterium]|nr:hypothetical protein [Bacteroidales bacterium]
MQTVLLEDFLHTDNIKTNIPDIKIVHFDIGAMDKQGDHVSTRYSDTVDTHLREWVKRFFPDRVIYFDDIKYIDKNGKERYLKPQ